MMHGQKHIELF